MSITISISQWTYFRDLSARSCLAGPPGMQQVQQLVDEVTNEEYIVLPPISQSLCFVLIYTHTHIYIFFARRVFDFKLLHHIIRTANTTVNKREFILKSYRWLDCRFLCNFIILWIQFKKFPFTTKYYNKHFTFNILYILLLLILIFFLYFTIIFFYIILSIFYICLYIFAFFLYF